jgi:hypothetical protein
LLPSPNAAEQAPINETLLRGALFVWSILLTLEKPDRSSLVAKKENLRWMFSPNRFDLSRIDQPINRRGYRMGYEKNKRQKNEERQRSV